LPTIPTFIGRFKIVSQIGKGGMGALYLAWDPTLEREIAIKLLRDDNDDLRERFAREARSVARLRHPHIVTVFDVGVHEDHPFIAMEYIKGQTLAEIIGSGVPLSIVRKLQLAEELCDGLAFAHKAGIVHRDVKPANIIVDEVAGSLKLLDFGIARVGPGMTQAGMLIGTLNYMSPEQVVGGAVDGRSDIFAVGTVLYELFARRQAFPGRLDTGILHKILHTSPESLEVLCSDLDPEIVQIVNRALEKDPAARYQELTAMRRDLQRVLRRLETSLPAEELSDDDATVLMNEPRPLTPTPRTPKGTDREALERRRASQIQTFLEAAGKAMNAGDYEAVVARCEEILLLDSDNAPAWNLLDRAKAALDERQADAWLDEARQHLERGELAAAADLAERGLQLNPAAAGGPSLLRRIEDARQERERLQQRIEVCRSALSRARDWLARGYFEDAAAAADQALAIDPAYPGALAVKQQAMEAEAKRRDLANQRAKETLDDAHRLAQSGDADAALALLDDFSPAHPDITTARDTLRSEIEARRREEARRRAEELRAEAERQERERRVRAALEQAEAALGRRDFGGALEMLRGLQKSDPDAAGLQTLIAEAEAQRLAAERARQIAIEIRSHLDAAAERFAAEDFNAAATHVQRALALDPDHAEAQSLASRIDDGARAAAERREQEAQRQREREQALAEAMHRAERASTHGAAIAALRDALAVDPDHQTARRLLTEHETAVDVERRLAAALARAKDASSTEASIAALRQALQIAPEHPEARRLLQEREEDLAREQAEARQLRERQEAIAAAIRQAAAATSHAAALAALQTALDIEPNHPEARRLFDARDAALKQEQAAERRRQEIDAACQTIDTQIANGALDAAEQGIAAFEQDPDAKKVMKTLRQRLQQARAAAERREQEARRQREREQALAEAMDRAERASTHGAAIAALRDALAVDPDHQTARRLLTEHETAVDVERRLAAALARAKDASSTEAAIAALRQALQIAPEHPEARRLLQEREEDLAREQAEARQLRERQEAIAAAIRQAAAATSHAAALAALQTALDIEPNHPEARRLFDARDAALKQEQAAERRRQEIDAACREIETQINSGAWDAAERVLAAFEQDRDAKKAMKALRRRLKQARAAADRRGEAATVLIAVPQTGESEPAGAASPALRSDVRPVSGTSVGARSPLVYLAAAVAVLMLLVIGYVRFIRQPAPRPVVTENVPAAPPVSTGAGPQTPGAPPAAPADRPVDQAGRAQGPAAAAPSAVPAPPAPEPPAVTQNQPPTIESQVAPLRRLARQQLVAGAHPQALATAMSGLRLAPKDRDLLRVVNDISTSARASVQRARQSAEAAGPAAVASGAFKDASARQELAARLERNRQTEPSLKAYLEAADLFTTAAAQARRPATTEQRTSPPPPALSAPPPAASTPATGSAPPAGAPTGATATQTPGVVAPAPPRETPPTASERPAPPATPPAPPAAAPAQTPLRSSAPPATAQTPPVAPAANDENLIRAVLQAYAQAYSALDVDAVRRVYPAVDAAALTQNFGQMRTQRIQIVNEQVAVTGTTATVTCQVRNHFEPKAGRVSDPVVNATFRLQKTGGNWVIVQRR
jgi:tetratricopeptide (TPR) repeat protein